MTLWGGRFREGPEPRFERFGESFSVDRRLLPQELRASEAWAEEIEQAGALTREERETIVAGLRWIAAQAASDPAFLEGAWEDVHTFVEAKLTMRVGPVARKLHAGRSRNDQVATDLRLWTRDALSGLGAGLAGLRGAILDLARRDGEAPMPGYTHLQRAQPLLFGHFLLAHSERFARDASRLKDAAARADACPLGSGALAGTALPIDRRRLALRLGFARPTANSLDAVSDRDFVAEILSDLALLGVHLSQLGEDIVLFATEEFGFLALSDAAATGSSLMPQKKNPDPAELLRARGAALIGAPVAMLSILKGLPAGYNRDLQEDKRLLFGAVDAALEALDIAALLLRHVSVRRERMRHAASSPGLYATEIADHLCREGVPFRDAHEAVGRAVRLAEDRGIPLDALGDADWNAVHPGLGAAAGRLFATPDALERRGTEGGTSPARVREAIERLGADLAGPATVPRGETGDGG
jgi:argininosuccinate lyase